ncbi:MAG: cytochrome c [Verrucomicrobiota bacterium]
MERKSTRSSNTPSTQFPDRIRRGLKERKSVLVGLSCLLCLSCFAEKPSPGLGVSYSSRGEKIISESAVAENVSLYVASGESPSPFLPGGKFTVSWTGFLSADLRSDFLFQAELNGALKLQINGVSVLEAVGTNLTSEFSKVVRLNKGTNLFSAIFTSPEAGHAYIRLHWQPKGGFAQPIPRAALSHFPTAEERTGQQLRLGRDLFVEHRCIKCHIGPESGMPELSMDAPSFDGIGSRRNQEWMARWILNPKQHRASAQMPKIFSGDTSSKNAEAVAAFLGSLNKSSYPAPGKGPMVSESGAGKKLFDTLHCAACHNAPDVAEMDVNKISLKQVRAKFAANALVEFLKQPDAHYAWIAMPRFKLSEAQRDELAAYLILNSEKAAAISPSSDSAIIESGKKLVQTSGCLNCHSLKLENKFTTKNLAQISNWKSGCLSDKADANSKEPQFNFSSEERDALQAFGGTDRASLSRHVSAEFAERQSRHLNCAECHGKVEGIPQFEILGGKLKPEWSARFIAGEIDYKPRPWLEAQMPAFPKRAQLLSEGFAQQHGFPAKSFSEPTHSDAEIGRNLVSAPPFGFSCISCHAVGSVGATQVFEAPGINLAHSGERLLPGYFKRWLRNPPLIDSMTKMPVYFDDEGKSPLADILDGSAEKQIEAIWEYLRLGDKMPAPKLQ